MKLRRRRKKDFLQGLKKADLKNICPYGQMFLFSFFQLSTEKSPLFFEVMFILILQSASGS